jgi:hypothetical protein
MEAQFMELIGLRNAEPFDIRNDENHKSVHRPHPDQFRIKIKNETYEMDYLRMRSIENNYYENYIITKYKNKGKWTKKELNFLQAHSFDIQEDTGKYGFAAKTHWDNE